MAAREELCRELERIRSEIDELREREIEIEAALGKVPRHLRWLQAPGAWLLKKETGAQIESLKLRHNIVHNCYLTLQRDEKRRQVQTTSRSTV